jgi:phosphorylcholine metabolism protein LicD
MDLVDEAKNNLEDFKRLAKHYEMRWMLMEGNLLGAYRDGNFTKDDENDIDIGIMEDEFYKFPEVQRDLELAGFVCKKLVVVDGEYHGGCWERNGNHIDIMKMKREGTTIYNIGEMGALRYDYPADIFGFYGKITFIGIECETPGKIEEFLTVRYGDWHKVIGRDEYSYRDPKYSPNVRCL